MGNNFFTEVGVQMQDYRSNDFAVGFFLLDCISTLPFLIILPRVGRLRYRGFWIGFGTIVFRMV